MLKWMCTRSDRIKNEDIRDKVRVSSVVDKLRLGSEKETCRCPGEEV